MNPSYMLLYIKICNISNRRPLLMNKTACHCHLKASLSLESQFVHCLGLPGSVAILRAQYSDHCPSIYKLFKL